MKSLIYSSLAFALPSINAVAAVAGTTSVSVTSEFATSEGFTTDAIGETTVISNLVSFSGGQQQQFFLGAAYNSGPDGYLFINGGTGFNGAPSSGDTGTIDFLGLGATTVSFHAANLANGPATSFTAFGVNGSNLGTVLTQVSTLSGTDPNEIISFNAVNGEYIDFITVNLPGPASPVNPPYAAAIDTFSATVVIPEPSTTLLSALAFSVLTFMRRRN